MSTFGNLRGILNNAFSIGKASPVELENSSGAMLVKTGSTERARFNGDGMQVTGGIKLASPATDLTANGVIIAAQVDANATGVGALLVLSSDGNWDEARANATATVGQLGIALESGTGAGKKILLYGLVRKDAWGWTTGSKLYVSGATAGAMTHTAPSTDGHQIQACGFAISADVVMFAPSPDIGEYVA
jgi:hypothetical protein